jgi:hypothetical protein
LKQIVAESVKKALNEISIDTLERARAQASKDWQNSMWDDDKTFCRKRRRQYNAFKDGIHQSKSEGGKKAFYIVKPGMSGFYDGDVEEIYMTPDEAKQYSEQHNCNVYTDYAKALRAADCSD